MEHTLPSVVLLVMVISQAIHQQPALDATKVITIHQTTRRTSQWDSLLLVLIVTMKQPGFLLLSIMTGCISRYFPESTKMNGTSVLTVTQGVTIPHLAVWVVTRIRKPITITRE